jgi:PAS domain S-box-containing protein
MTFTAMIANWLGVVPTDTNAPQKQKQQLRPFCPAKELCETDLVLIDMLNSEGHDDVCYCVCDPEKLDCPIIFASEGFCAFTGYSCQEIEGRNCRFLQGPATSAADVSVIRKAIQGYSSAQQQQPLRVATEPSSVSVNLLNYHKDGTSFYNEFFLAPLRNNNHKVQYLIGVQCPVSKLGPGQGPKNAGYVR